MKAKALFFLLAATSTTAFGFSGADSVCSHWGGGHYWCAVVVNDSGGDNVQVSIQRVEIKSNWMGVPDNIYGDCAGGQHLREGSPNFTTWVPRWCLD